ncbi:MAG: hypothetical protein PHS31_03515 [Victivallaceae bacterium]|nr:hypothetical protein [Victivallaceae bacterium]MDD4181449.1 hypothetical protein [Victivallaceae bacterium]
MQKIIPISINDIIANEESCSEMLNHACLRGESWRVTGGGAVDRTFWVILENLEDDNSKPAVTYRFARLCRPNDDEITATAKARWAAGFAILAVFEASNDVWALFSSK